MSLSRLELLKEYYQQDPNDPFNVYALAIEYLKADVERSKEYFNELLDKHPDYLPSYYHAAKLFIDLNDKEKAIVVYEKGIALAKEKKEFKALRELQSAFDALMFE
jgi:tetratricopeptide (TPR) repeat protein